MISTRHGFLFVHIPKCAGNAIQGALAAYSDDRLVHTKQSHEGVDNFEVQNPSLGTRKHTTLQAYRQKLDPGVYESLFKFACVRNPWDRMLSHFAFKRSKRGRSGMDAAAFERFILMRPSIAHYVSTGGSGQGRAGDAERSPFSEIDVYIRFERLNEDFETVCKKLDLPIASLPVRNPGSHEHYSQYYDENTMRAVELRFRDEIEYFGYRFERP